MQEPSFLPNDAFARVLMTVPMLWRNGFNFISAVCSKGVPADPSVRLRLEPQLQLEVFVPL